MIGYHENSIPVLIGGKKLIIAALNSANTACYMKVILNLNVS